MIEADEMKAFFDKCIKAGNGDFKKELEVFLEGIGVEFLRIIEDEIIRRKVVDTRLLLNSFHKGDKENFWEISDGGLTLQVGSNAEYAGYVNDGHWTCGKGEAMRFVPGYWKGDRFVYDPDAKTGMMLKQKFVKGKHFWEDGIKILEKILPSLAEKMIDDFMKKYFG